MQRRVMDPCWLDCHRIARKVLKDVIMKFLKQLHQNKRSQILAIVHAEKGHNKTDGSKLLTKGSMINIFWAKN